jgi:hypothetical protein
MGLYFEDRLIRAKKDGDEIEKLVYEGYAEVDAMFKEKGGVIILDRDFEEKKDTTGTNSMPAPPIALPMSVPMYIDSLGAVNIRYSKSAPQRTNDGKSVIYPSARLLVYDKMILTDREKDLAWFMLKATNFIERKGEANPSAFLKINDPQKEVTDKISKLKRNALVDEYLLRDDSLLFNKDSMQAIADRFGIKLDEKSSVEINAFVIREAVIAGDEHPKNNDINIDLFIDFADKMLAKMKKNKASKPDNPPSEDVNKEPKIETPVVLSFGEYTENYLSNLTVSERNEISKGLELDSPPKCTKVEQISQILEKQALSKT